MSTAIIACEMLEDELAAAQKKAGTSYQPIWLERQLHTAPERLRAALQQAIDDAGQHDTLLMAFTRCGNALLGVHSQTARLVLPRYDDCLHMVRSTGPADIGQLDIRTLYLTRGWLEGDRAFLNEYNACLAKRGEKKTRRIYDIMMSEYRSLALIDTGAYPLDDARPLAKETAAALRLGYTEAEGNNRVLEKLLAGAWDEDFIVLAPGQPFTDDHFTR